MAALTSVAKPEIHLVRGVQLPQEARDAVTTKGVASSVGQVMFSYVKDDYRQRY